VSQLTVPIPPVVSDDFIVSGGVIKLFNGDITWLAASLWYELRQDEVVKMIDESKRVY